MAELVLASGSERRRALLLRLGLRFQVVVPNVDETLAHGICTELAVQLLARSKAHAVTAPRSAFVLAADTVVVGPEGPLGKPHTCERARQMLQSLRGRRHLVLTGSCALSATTGREQMGVSRAVVRMRDFSDEELEQYLAGGEPLDKAGAYAIQGQGSSLVDEVVGRSDTVIGLDCATAMRLLGDIGYPDPLPTAPAPRVALGPASATRRPLAGGNWAGAAN